MLRRSTLQQSRLEIHFPQPVILINDRRRRVYCKAAAGEDDLLYCTQLTSQYYGLALCGSFSFNNSEPNLFYLSDTYLDAVFCG